MWRTLGNIKQLSFCTFDISLAISKYLLNKILIFLLRSTMYTFDVYDDAFIAYGCLVNIYS